MKVKMFYVQLDKEPDRTFWIVFLEQMTWGPVVMKLIAFVIKYDIFGI